MNRTSDRIRQLEAEVARLNNELNQQRTFYQSLLNHIPHIVFGVTNDQITFANQSFCDWVGKYTEEIIGHSVASLIPPVVSDAWFPLYKRALCGEIVDAEEQFPDGVNLTNLRILCFPITNEHGAHASMGTIVIDNTAHYQTEQLLRESTLLLNGVLQYAPAVIYLRDIDGTLRMVNDQYVTFMQRYMGLNLTRDDFVGHNQRDIFPDYLIRIWDQNDADMLRTGAPTTSESMFEVEGQQSIYYTMQFPIWDEQGTIRAFGGISTDITLQKQAEQQRAAMQQQVIDAQQQVLRELSTPLIPIAKHVLVMPLVGSIDSQRAKQVVENLLDGVQQYAAHTVILDITGVRVVDTRVANAFIQAAKAVRLLGSQVVITGIQPHIAQTIIDLGIDLKTIKTHQSLQTMIAHVLHD